MPSAMSSSGVGFPRTSTKDSQDGGRYRRKVGFEAFEAGPEALFAYTCQVSRIKNTDKGSLVEELADTLPFRPRAKGTSDHGTRVCLQ